MKTLYNLILKAEIFFSNMLKFIFTYKPISEPNFV